MEQDQHKAELGPKGQESAQNALLKDMPPGTYCLHSVPTLQFHHIPTECHLITYSCRSFSFSNHNTGISLSPIARSWELSKILGVNALPLVRSLSISQDFFF